jgi:hypothetical protein
VNRAAKALALTACAAALAVAGCGGSDEPEGEKLPPEISQTLLQQLDSISDRVAAEVPGACDDIFAGAPTGNIEPIDAALSSIPSDVNPEIRSALEQSIDRLKQLVNDECAAISDAAAQDDTTTEEAPVETVTEETDTTPTETVTAPTTPDTTETEPTPPEGPGNGPNGNGPDGNGPPGQDGGGFEAPSD